MLYIILFFIFSVVCFIPFILGYKAIDETYYDYDWSSSWSELDRRARLGADCKPLATIHRKFGKLSAWIYIVPDSCEQGLPHTRAVDVIAIPKSYPKDRLASTLDHEVVHLYQRLMPDSWAKFYKQKWNYDIYKESPVGMPEDLVKRKRANPDTALAPWCCWSNIYWPVSIYESDLSLSKAPTKWWNQENNTISTNAPDSWSAFFGPDINQLEHPHEISAELLAGPLKADLPNNASPAMILLKKAWNQDNMYPSVI